VGRNVAITASDGHTFDAYLAEPAARTRGGLVVLQEIFGVNRHVRRVCDGLAAEGYAAIAPALFDRIERGVELGYEPESTPRGRALRGALGWDAPMLDACAAADAVRSAGRVGAIGYCWGGSLAFLAAARLEIAAAVGYYGAQIAGLSAEAPRCPVLLHFGERDALIPPADVAAVRAARPEALVFTYEADHGFNCDERASYDAPAAALARARTLAFLGEHLG
jgi:carboxymethylenebutenolidase